MTGGEILLLEENTTIDLIYDKNVETTFIKFITILYLHIINLY